MLTSANAVRAIFRVADHQTRGDRRRGNARSIPMPPAAHGDLKQSEAVADEPPSG